MPLNNFEKLQNTSLFSSFTGTSVHQAYQDPSGLKYSILPHPNAPLFSNPLKSQQVITELITELSSPNFQSENFEVIKYIKQLSYVSLWFFLTYIAGFNGPYDKMNSELHLDMCNFRQSPHCMKDGARGAAFIPRGMSKSTILTHGANTWEILRNPDIRIKLVNATHKKAKNFRDITKLNFDSNELIKILFPDYIPLKVPGPEWNNEILIMPNRTRVLQDQTLEAGGITAAAEGGHFDLLSIDDPVGLDELTSDNSSGLQMEQAKNWFKTNKNALLDSWTTSRIMFVGTRYAADDVGSLIMNNMHTLIGYQHPNYPPRKDGEWAVYYRLAIERDESIFPEKFPKDKLLKLMEEDWWTFVTQYMNDPQKAGITEFADYKVKYCKLYYSDQEQDYIIEKVLSDESETFHDEIPYVFLSDCHCIITCDPAGTEAGESLVNCRSSIGVWAMDWNNNAYRIWSKVGMFSPEQLFAHIVLAARTFQGYFSATFFEENGMQRTLKKLLQNYAEDQKIDLKLGMAKARGNKIARIRTLVGTKLSQQKLYVTRESGKEFIEEQMIFPGSRNRVDVLDESSMAIDNLVVPISPLQKIKSDVQYYEEDYYDQSVHNAVGY